MSKIYWIFLFFLLPVVAAGATNGGEKADLVVVEKGKHLLSLYKRGKLFDSYHVVFGSNPAGTKEKEGDGRTPEGRYVLDIKKSDSVFYKAFHVSYPNQDDIEQAKKVGVLPGGDIMIHGQKNGFGWASFLSQRFNWTRGCIALANDDIDAMWEAVDSGTAIEILP